MRIDQKSTNNFETKKSSEKTIVIIKTLLNKYIIINITLNNKKLRIILNSNVLENFVAEKYTHYHDLFVRRKTIVYSLMSVNESIIDSERVTDETTIILKIDEHRKKITLNIVDIINHDVIFDILWFRK